MPFLSPSLVDQLARQSMGVVQIGIVLLRQGSTEARLAENPIRALQQRTEALFLLDDQGAHLAGVDRLTEMIEGVLEGIGRQIDQ